MRAAYLLVDPSSVPLTLLVDSENEQDEDEEDDENPGTPGAACTEAHAHLVSSFRSVVRVGGFVTCYVNVELVVTKPEQETSQKLVRAWTVTGR